MNKVLRIIICFIIGILVYASLIGFRLNAQANDKFDFNFFVTIFSLILIILGITILRKKDMRKSKDKNMLHHFWIIFIIAVIFILFIGNFYFLHYKNIITLNLFNWIYQLIELTLAVLFCFFSYYLIP